MEHIEFFNDNVGRKIEIGIDRDEITAMYQNGVVGQFQFDKYEDDFVNKPILAHCDIKIPFQKAGIGSRMIMISESYFGDFHISNHLSEEGAALLNSCRRRNLFQFAHAIKDDPRF